MRRHGMKIKKTESEKQNGRKFSSLRTLFQK